MGLTVAVFAAFVVIWLGPDIPLRRAARHLFVETPARLLNTGPLALAARVFAVAVVIGMIVGAPELFLLLGVADVAVIMEVVALAMLLGAVVRLQGLARSAVSRVRAGAARLRPAVRRAGRQSSLRRVRRTRSAKTDEDGPARALPCFA